MEWLLQRSTCFRSWVTLEVHLYPNSDHAAPIGHDNHPLCAGGICPKGKNPFVWSSKGCHESKEVAHLVSKRDNHVRAPSPHYKDPSHRMPLIDSTHQIKRSLVIAHSPTSVLTLSTNLVPSIAPNHKKSRVRPTSASPRLFSLHNPPSIMNTSWELALLVILQATVRPFTSLSKAFPQEMKKYTTEKLIGVLSSFLPNSMLHLLGTQQPQSTPLIYIS